MHWWGHQEQGLQHSGKISSTALRRYLIAYLALGLVEAGDLLDIEKHAKNVRSDTEFGSKFLLKGQTWPKIILAIDPQPSITPESQCSSQP
jgi:hypothetical protein